jgi:signal transduction histidine kinase/ligand-binding sensor domain-containing protein
LLLGGLAPGRTGNDSDLTLFAGRKPYWLDCVRFSVVRLTLFAVCAYMIGPSRLLTAEPQSAWSVRIWTRDGLSDRNIMGIAQTPDGFLWVATPHRLARFDGSRFEEYNPTALLPIRERRIRAVCRSRDGGIWLATDWGQIAYLGPRGTRVITRGLPREMVDTMVEDREGGLWVSFARGRISVCRLLDGTVTPYAYDGESEDGRSSVTMDSSGSIWMVRLGEISVFRDGRFVKMPVRSIASARILGSSKGGLWLAASIGIFHYEEGEPLERCEASARFAGFPFVMLEDHTGALWVGTVPDGLFRYTRDRGVERIATSYPEINCLAEDREGNIWAGTAGGGLNRVTPRAVAVDGSATAFPQQAIQSICQDANGAFWSATQNGLLQMRAADGNWQTKPGWPIAVTSIAADPEDGVWVGTRRRSLHHLLGGKMENWGPEQGLAGHTIGVITAGRDGTVWLAGEGPTSLQRLRQGKFFQYTLRAPITRIETMEEDGEGRIWMGTSDGTLLRVEGDQLANVTPEGAPHSALRGLHATPDGTLWLGYRTAGLGRLRDGQFTHIGTEEGLFSDSVVHLVSDESGWLWCGGEDGVFKVRLQALADFAEHRAASVQCVHYGTEAGLPNLQVTAKPWGRAVRDRAGQIWIPMGPALITIEPARAGEHLDPRAVFLTRVRVDAQTVAEYRGMLAAAGGIAATALPRRDALQVAPVRQRIEFDFTALSFAAPENVQFRYRLLGFDDEWVASDTARNAAYAHVPAGRYEFRVQACNSEGVWNESGARLAVVIAPFFWQTWWFRSAVLLGFTGVTVLIVRRVSHRRLQRKVQVLRQQMVLERDRARIARDLHDEAGNRLTRVALLSRLAWRDRTQPEKAESHLVQLSAAAREATDAFDEIVWAVNPRNDTLSELVSYLGHYANQLCQAAGLNCTLDVPVQLTNRNMPTDVRHNLFLATKEAVHNVVRHARATEMKLQVSVSDAALTIEVADNGRGMPVEVTAPGADGLRNFAARMKEIGGEFTVASTPGGGTRLTFVYRWPKGK